jgi:hypothetical protein
VIWRRCERLYTLKSRRDTQRIQALKKVPIGGKLNRREVGPRCESVSGETGFLILHCPHQCVVRQKTLGDVRHVASPSGIEIPREPRWRGPQPRGRKHERQTAKDSYLDDRARQCENGYDASRADEVGSMQQRWYQYRLIHEPAVWGRQHGNEHQQRAMRHPIPVVAASSEEGKRPKTAKGCREIFGAR